MFLACFCGVFSFTTLIFFKVGELFYCCGGTDTHCAMGNLHLLPIVYSTDGFFVTGRYEFLHVLVNCSLSIWG